MNAQNFELTISSVTGDTPSEGSDGKTFAIRVQNHTCYRVLAMVTVGDSPVIREGSAGYIIEPHSFVSISGWRSQSVITPFSFEEFVREGIVVINAAIYREQKTPLGLLCDWVYNGVNRFFGGARPDRKDKTRKEEMRSERFKYKKQVVYLTLRQDIPRNRHL